MCIYYAALAQVYSENYIHFIHHSRKREAEKINKNFLWGVRVQTKMRYCSPFGDILNTMLGCDNIVTWVISMTLQQSTAGCYVILMGRDKELMFQSKHL